MAKKNALGSGLGELLGEVQNAYEKNLGEYTESIVELSVDIIKPNPFQPRKVFDTEALKDLASSIAEHGLLQPVLVYEDEGEYFLIAGERRLRASKLAKKGTIKAVIANEYIDKGRLRELAIVENIQRENLNPLDLAHSYQELIDDYNITHEELAKKLKKSRVQITNTLRILELSEYVQDLIVQNKLTQGHAKIMVGLPEKEQQVLADSVIGQKLSVRETEQLAKNMKLGQSNRQAPKKTKNSSSNEAFEELLIVLEEMGVSAQVARGKITITPKGDEILLLIKKLKS